MSSGSRGCYHKNKQKIKKQSDKWYNIKNHTQKHKHKHKHTQNNIHNTNKNENEIENDNDNGTTKTLYINMIAVIICVSTYHG